MASGDTVLVTGGAGFVGSHTVVELCNAGYNVVVVDNFCNASTECLKRVEKLVGQEIPAHTVDLLDTKALAEVFNKHKIDHVIHMAALKAVGESVEKPLLYYRNNLDGTMNLLEAMSNAGVKSFIFSSSATVYGNPASLPISEELPVGAGITNPYGQTKFFSERIVMDLVRAQPEWRVTILRYFNPVGAHKSGTIGENPSGTPNNLMPYLSQVAVGRREFLSVFGNDYPTPDGTGVRDYIHIVDLAEGHVCALNKQRENTGGCKIYNLGTGRGYSVLEMVTALEKASGKKIPYKILPRREGDLAELYADASKAEKELGWTAKRGLDEMCEDIWRWQSNNPNGFS